MGPAGSESLYRLRCPGPHDTNKYPWCVQERRLEHKPIKLKQHLSKKITPVTKHYGRNKTEH